MKNIIALIAVLISSRANAVGPLINGNQINPASDLAINKVSLPSTVLTSTTAIFNGGSMGIGTASPTRSLSINHATNPNIGFKVADAEKWVIDITNTNFAVFNNNDATYPWTIKQGGNVGIGTASPGAALDVVSATGIDIGSGTAVGQGYGRQSFGVATTDSYDIFGRVGHSLGLGANGTTSMTISKTNGFVGISTTTPQGELNVQGTIGFGGSGSHTGVVMVSNGTVPAKNVGIGYDNTEDAGYIGATHAGTAQKPLYINANGGGVRLNTTTSAGTQLYYCTAGTQAGMLMRGAGTIAVVCTASTALGIYVP